MASHLQGPKSFKSTAARYAEVQNEIYGHPNCARSTFDTRASMLAFAELPFQFLLDGPLKPFAMLH